MTIRKLTILFLALLLAGFVFVGCTNGDAGEEPGNEQTNGENVINNGQEQETVEYLVYEEGLLSFLDGVTALEMCEDAIDAYLRAIWNGEEIDLDLFVDNVNLKQYMEKQIEDEFASYGKKNTVNDVKVGILEIQHVINADENHIYLKLPYEVVWTQGARGEVMEFLVSSADNSLVIVDWYNGGKFGYDSSIRGESAIIDKPEIWNDAEWVAEVLGKQDEK